MADQIELQSLVCAQLGQYTRHLLVVMEAAIVGGVEYSLVEDRSMMEKVARLHDEVFLTEEPVCKWFCDLGIYFDEECLQAYREDVIRKLAEGYSVVATHHASGKVVRARVSFRLNESIKADDMFQVDERLEKHVRYQFDHLIFETCYSFDRVLQHLPDVKEVLVFHYIFIHSDYRGLGIAKELITRSLGMARKSGFDAVLVCSTSDIIKAVYEKIGFKRIHQMRYTDFDLSKFPLHPSQYKDQTADVYILRL